jgi:dTMP kinase
MLTEWLRASGYEVVNTREPGGTPIAETIREMLLDPANKALASTAELLLYAAARAQHVAELIRPALAAGKVVICDRFADSTTAYQGAGRGLRPETVASLHAIATDGVWPDLTVVIDVTVEEGLARARGRSIPLNRLEQESLAFHHRVRAGFLALAESEPERVKRVDGTRPTEQVHASIAAMVRDVLEMP